MRITLLLGLCVAGCDAIGSDTGPQQIFPPVTGCPDGMSKAAESELVPATFLYDGLSWALVHDGSRSYDGESAACISEDGLAMRLLFEAGGDYVGALTVSTSEVGSFDMESSDSASFELFLEGFDPATVWSPESATWQSGVMIVSALDPLEVSIQGTGVSEGHGLSFAVNAAAVR